jgi:hypothetical protein
MQAVTRPPSIRLATEIITKHQRLRSAHLIVTISRHTLWCANDGPMSRTSTTLTTQSMT